MFGAARSSLAALIYAHTGRLLRGVAVLPITAGLPINALNAVVDIPRKVHSNGAAPPRSFPRRIAAALARDRVVVALTLAGMMAFSTFFFQVPYYWDSFWITTDAQYILENHFKPLTLPGWDPQGHPLLLPELLAVAWFVLGQQLWVSHLLMTTIGFVAMYYTYRTGAFAYGREVGLVAAILLLFYPLFIVQSTTIQLDFLAGATTIVTIYYVLTGRVQWYLVSASLMVLSKAPTVLLIPAVLLYVFTRDYRRRSCQRLALELAAYALPIVVLAGWFWYHSNFIGWAISPDQPGMQPGRLLSAYLPNALFSHGGVVEQFAGITLRYFGRISLTGLLTVLLFVYALDVPGIIASIRGGTPLRVTLTHMQLRSILHRWEPSRYLLILALPILLQLLFMASNFALFRYLLPAFPPFFVLVARALTKIFHGVRATALATATVAGVFVAGAVTPLFGYDLYSPSIFTYLDYVQAHRQAATFLESNYPGKVVLAGWPAYIELAMPMHGYVQHPLPILAYPPELCGDKPCSQFVDRMAGLGGRYFVAPEEVSLSDFDLVYYSIPDWPQLQDGPDVVPRLVERFQLPVLAEFRSNSGRVVIYGKASV